ncbi:GntR family transcriptional regulator [Corynebacterium sp. S7]
MANARSATLDSIRRLILSGEWAPGTRLQPSVLAKQLDTSTTVVREALVHLTGTGLVVSRPNRGFFVRDLELQELEDLTELRIQTEALALKLAIERGSLDWESEIIAANYQLDRTPRRDPESPDRVSFDWQSLHKVFHLKLIEACNCEPMIRISSDLFDSTELYRSWAAKHVAPDSRDVEGEHKEILDAVIDKDVERATRALRLHYEATVEVVLDSGLIATPSLNK